MAQYLIALRKFVLKSVTSMIFGPSTGADKKAGARALVLCGHADPSSHVGTTNSSKRPVCTVIYTASDRS